MRGSRAVRQRLVGDEGAYTFRTCITCYGIIAHLCESDVDYRIDGVDNDAIFEYVQQEFKGDWNAADAKFNPPPPPPAPWISDDQLDDMLHALGQTQTPKREKMGWRNHFTSSGAHAGWDDLVSKGLATRQQHNGDGFAYFVSDYAMKILGVKEKP